MQVLIDSKSEINAIHLSFVKQLDFPIRPIDIGAQKIDNTTQNINKMVVVVFSVVDKANQVRFFKETFLFANVSPSVVFEMLFFVISSANVDFSGRELCWRTYTIKKALLTTRRIELVGKNEFTTTVLDPEYETYVVHVISLKSTALDVHPFRRSQISGLIAKKALIKIYDKYINFVDVFSLDLASKLSKHTRIDNHAIELVDYQQPPYGPIYSLGPVELETVKAYIKTNLANGIIRPSKSPAGTLILFDRKLDGFLRVCINYQGFNNLIIINRYPFPMIGESLDRLKKAWQFTQLDFTSAYHQIRIYK